MKQQRLLKQILTALTIIGAVALLIMLSTAMVHYASDADHYTENFLPTVLIPFITTFLVTLILGVFAYLIPGKEEYSS